MIPTTDKLLGELQKLSRAKLKASHMLTSIKSWFHFLAKPACCPTQVPSTDFLDPNGTCQNQTCQSKSKLFNQWVVLSKKAKHDAKEDKRGMRELANGGLPVVATSKFGSNVKRASNAIVSTPFCNSSAGHTQGIELH